jgi:hypothetical protein
MKILYIVEIIMGKLNRLIFFVVEIKNKKDVGHSFLVCPSGLPFCE